MARADWSSTARALADQFEDEDDHILPVHESRRSNSPIWSRRSLDDGSASQHRPRNGPAKWMQTADQWNRKGMRMWYKLTLLQRTALSLAGVVLFVLSILFLVYNERIFAWLSPAAKKWMQTANQWNRKGLRMWYKLTLLQRTALSLAGVVLFVLSILFLVYNERIFAWLSPAAKKWRELPAGWLILFFMTFFVSFPPMIGYSTCVTIAGFVFGMKGWLIMAPATIIGSTVSFIVSRTVLKGFVSKMTEKNKQFAALSLVLKHDGLKLLCMIRLCPLPYSFANGAISTIQTVTWPNFMLATAIASPKLLLHIFVGARIGDIAENGDKMDTKTKIVSYLSAAIGIVVGIGTGYLIYVRTKARAKQLEAEEAAAVANARRGSNPDGDYIDDPDEQEAIDILRSRDDDISLHPTYEDEPDLDTGYRDEFTDDEDAQERDVFDDGDGDEEDASSGKKGPQ